MDSNDRIDPIDGVDASDRRDDGTYVEPGPAPAAAANINGMAPTPFPGTGVAAAGELAADETAMDDDVGAGELNLDALDRFGSRRGETGDQGVSARQRETESDELNG